MSSPPSSPRSLSLMRPTSSAPSSLLMWMEPENPYGTVIRFDILVSEFNDTGTATVRGTVNGTTFSFDLSQLDLMSGSYFVWVSTCIILSHFTLSSKILFIYLFVCLFVRFKQ